MRQTSSTRINRTLVESIACTVGHVVHHHSADDLSGHGKHGLAMITLTSLALNACKPPELLLRDAGRDIGAHWQPGLRRLQT